MKNIKKAIYGAGQYGSVLYKAMKEKEIEVDFFIDEYTNKKELFGKKIYKLKDAPKAIVYNSVATYEKEILENLKKLGFEYYTFVETLKQFPNVIEQFLKEKYLWLRDDKPLINECLKDVKKLLSDEKSLDIFDKIINFRKTFDMKYYPYPNDTLENQYFCKDIPLFERLNAFRFIDCGAFIGDSIESIINFSKTINKKIESIVSFEIDEKNYQKLQKVIYENAKLYLNIKMLSYPMGVYSKNTILKFNSIGSGSRICDKGEKLIPVCSLDSTVYGLRPNYIKMDIEGSEKEALIGAKNIIKDFKPNLAISIYHKPEDLWEIPLLIKTLNPDYKMYIRVHNHMGIETVLYCVN
jgi:FkbM family methyltransferase